MSRLAPDQRLHIIECKGTTQGRAAIRGAFKTAQQQKYSIRFKNDTAYVSQRLSVGLAIAKDRNAKRSTLYVEDPDGQSQPSGAYQIEDGATLEQIQQAILTSMLIERSALAGAFDVIAAASIAFDGAEQTNILGERELPIEMTKFEAGGNSWLGQEFVALTPVALTPNHRRSRIIIRSGISPRLYDSLVVPDAWRDTKFLLGAAQVGLKPVKKRTLDEVGLRCSIQFGDEFLEDLSITEMK